MQKSVLLIGTGFVAQPIIDILSATEGINVTVACRTLSSAQKLAAKFKSKAISLDVRNDIALDAAVANHDLIISLIPYIYHPNVIKSAIRLKKDVLTTSYISPTLKKLEPDIIKAGITIMNEIGLDPGIDHLYAVKTITDVHKVGGKIKSFISYCGGLPAPENSNNPLGYKFSWSSKGVLLALRNSAKYWKDGNIETLSSDDLMLSATPYVIYPGYAFVCYPNRDSTLFKELYHIPEADTVIRGTLRYQGFPEFIKVLVDIGMLSENENEAFFKAIPWSQALAQYLCATSSSKDHLISAINSRTKWKSNEEKERILSGLSWLGLFSKNCIVPRRTALDTLCATLEKLMQYEEGERDMVVLQHKFGIEWADGTTEIRTSTLINYGDPEGYSSMAITVGYPAAVAAKLVLDGTIKGPGLIGPYSPEINNPIMNELKKNYGIYLKEDIIS